MIEVPKILIYGQPFNDLSGGGITISNLFKGWPKDKLAVTFVAWGTSIFSSEICDNYYLIGGAEHKWRFPLNWFKRPFPVSGVISDIGKQQIIGTKSKFTFRKTLSDFINPILHWLGIYHVATRIILSDKQKAWILDYKPEILYLQVSTLEGIDFANQLIDYLKIPSVMHIMDDWPSTLGRKGLFAGFWGQKVNNKFIKLLDKTSCCFTISDAMAIEYEKRYRRPFDAFHNPVEIEHNKLTKVGKFETDHSFFKVLYVGRIGTANKQSILSFAKAISKIKIHEREIHFVIFSKDVNDTILDPIRSFKNVFLNQAIPHSQIHNLFSKYDLLLLPLDFIEDAIRFAKFSIPTKATEYMLSGVPILVFAPEETAVSRFFTDHDCGFCLTRNSSEDILNAINYLISNASYRMKISRNAVKVATEKFDAKIVRARFQSILTSVSKRE